MLGLHLLSSAQLSVAHRGCVVLNESIMKWTPRTLDELGYVGRGRSRHRPRDAVHLYNGPYPFIQTADVKHARLYVNRYSQTYSEEGLAQSRLWKTGTLCITIAANIADTAILGIDACFPDSVIGFIADDRKADARFVKYLFDAAIQERFKQFTQGVAQDNLSNAKLLSLRFSVPEVEHQRRIADVLSSYDDLIENNRRRIRLLEQAVRLIYEEWFVRLCFRGCDLMGITDRVPEGWTRKPLRDLCRDIRETVDPKTLPPDTAYIGLEHIPRRSITLIDWASPASVDSAKFKFLEGDILFGKIRPYFHKVGFALVDGITSSDAVVVRPTNPDLYEYLLLLLSSDQFVALASKTVREGSKMPRADWKFLLKSAILVPGPQHLDSFREMIRPVLDQLRNLAWSCRRLAQARDLLLPRLMRGETAA